MDGRRFPRIWSSSGLTHDIYGASFNSSLHVNLVNGIKSGLGSQRSHLPLANELGTQWNEKCSLKESFAVPRDMKGFGNIPPSLIPLLLYSGCSWAQASTGIRSRDLKFGIDRIVFDENSLDNSVKTNSCFPGKALNGQPFIIPTEKWTGYGRNTAIPPPYTFPLTTHEGAHHRLFDSKYFTRSTFPGPYSVLGRHSHDPYTYTASAGRRKRSWTRAVFSSLQRKGLEKRFELQKYVSKNDRRQIAAMLGLTDAQVKVWFQNRRMKWRQAKEKEERDLEKNGTESTKDVGEISVAQSSVH